MGSIAGQCLAVEGAWMKLSPPGTSSADSLSDGARGKSLSGCDIHTLVLYRFLRPYSSPHFPDTLNVTFCIQTFGACYSYTSLTVLGHSECVTLQEKNGLHFLNSVKTVHKLHFTYTCSWSVLQCQKCQHT